MPAFTADLHNHTPALGADYRGSMDTTAREIVETAVDAGIDVFAVTDHFCWAFASELIEAAEDIYVQTGRRLLVVPGAELRLRENGDEVHIAALFPPEGFHTAFKTLFEMLDIALSEVGDCDLPAHAVNTDPVRVCRLIDSLGGIAIVAHADRVFGSYRLLDSPLFERLLLEEAVLAVDMLDHSSGELLLAARDVSLIGCSDSHALEEIGRRRSLVAMPELSFAGLREALSRRATVHLGAIA